jgi:hypothetical protein
MECPSCGCPEACSCHCHDGKRPIDFLAAGIQGVPQFSKRERSLIRQALQTAANLKENEARTAPDAFEWLGLKVCAKKKAAEFRELKKRFRKVKNA